MKKANNGMPHVLELALVAGKEIFTGRIANYISDELASIASKTTNKILAHEVVLEIINRNDFDTLKLLLLLSASGIINYFSTGRFNNYSKLMKEMLCKMLSKVSSEDLLTYFERTDLNAEIRELIARNLSDIKKDKLMKLIEKEKNCSVRFRLCVLCVSLQETNFDEALGLYSKYFKDGSLLVDVVVAKDNRSVNELFDLLEANLPPGMFLSPKMFLTEYRLAFRSALEKASLVSLRKMLNTTNSDFIRIALVIELAKRKKIGSVKLGHCVCISQEFIKGEYLDELSSFLSTKVLLALFKNASDVDIKKQLFIKITAREDCDIVYINNLYAKEPREEIRQIMSKYLYETDAISFYEHVKDFRNSNCSTCEHCGTDADVDSLVKIFGDPTLAAYFYKNTHSNDQLAIIDLVVRISTDDLLAIYNNDVFKEGGIIKEDFKDLLSAVAKELLRRRH